MTDDIDRIMHVMACAFDPVWGEAWNRRQVSDSLLMPNIHYRLSNPHGEPPADNDITAGFTLIRAAPGEEELLLIAVDPAYRGRGLGKAMLKGFMEDACQRSASRIYLEMRANNPAEHLYRSVGFEPIGRRKDYYRAPGDTRIDAITFAMDLEQLA